MDRSKLSQVISITRLLPHFSQTSIDAIKHCIFDQLEIQTESQFLCMVLSSLYKSLSPQSLSTIRTKAFEIAENQLMNQQTQTTNTTSHSNATGASQQQQSNMTVCQHIRKQYDNGLCQLHSDIIDYFGTFLTKKESIELGYLNKHLFIETQKQSYLLKRCKDKIFTIDSKTCSKILIGKNDAFNHTFPRSLSLDLYFPYSNMVQNIPFFNNFFRRLSILHCNSFSSLCCVPLKHLFVKNRNYYPNSESCDNIDVFRLTGDLSTKKKEATIKYVDAICENFDKLILDHSSSPDKIRGIEKFDFASTVQVTNFRIQDSYADYRACLNSLSKRVLMRFGSISKSIHLRDIKLTFHTISELKTFFHSDLRHIYLDDSSSIIIKIDMKNIENVENSGSILTSSLESIEFWTTGSNMARCMNALNEFDKFDVRLSVKQYIVHWSPPSSIRSEGLYVGDIAGVLEKVFFQDYDKHPLLESIVIKFNDNRYLFGLARLLVFFHEHYQQLFVQRKLSLPHYQTIEIDIEKIAEPLTIAYGTEYPEFFEQKRNKEYSMDDKRVEIKSSQLKYEMESFATIYQNVFCSLQKIQDKSCKITFCIE